ncbi:hypothetical protein Agub_g1022 [Astrephomene gubernaculifera]|uniref:histone acetyltransferase n=1 Tax=Astrephomene gubernaculifera TaxID=47775 RepID=A0AAD3DHF5_9CHLO|nr:hypothetical protein Agub_g1022 [Astrephomene gubernaculifera]
MTGESVVFADAKAHARRSPLSTAERSDAAGEASRPTCDYIRYPTQAALSAAIRTPTRVKRSNGGCPSALLRALENRHRWLLFAQHCYTCAQQEGECELGKLCTYGKRTLQHVMQCGREQCCYPRCGLLKPLLEHSRRCQSPTCAICVPVWNYIQRDLHHHQHHRHHHHQQQQQQPPRQQPDADALPPPARVQPRPSAAAIAATLAPAGNNTLAIESPPAGSQSTPSTTAAAATALTTHIAAAWGPVGLPPTVEQQMGAITAGGSLEASDAPAGNGGGKFQFGDGGGCSNGGGDGSGGNGGVGTAQDVTDNGSGGVQLLAALHDAAADDGTAAGQVEAASDLDPRQAKPQTCPSPHTHTAQVKQECIHDSTVAAAAHIASLPLFNASPHAPLGLHHAAPPGSLPAVPPPYHSLPSYGSSFPAATSGHLAGSKAAMPTLPHPPWAVPMPALGTIMPRLLPHAYPPGTAAVPYLLPHFPHPDPPRPHHILSSPHSQPVPLIPAMVRWVPWQPGPSAALAGQASAPSTSSAPATAPTQTSNEAGSGANATVPAVPVGNPRPPQLWPTTQQHPRPGGPMVVHGTPVGVASGGSAVRPVGGQFGLAAAGAGNRSGGGGGTAGTAGVTVHGSAAPTALPCWPGHIPHNHSLTAATSKPPPSLPSPPAAQQLLSGPTAPADGSARQQGSGAAAAVSVSGGDRNPAGAPSYPPLQQALLNPPPLFSGQAAGSGINGSGSVAANGT